MEAKPKKIDRSETDKKLLSRGLKLMTDLRNRSIYKKQNQDIEEQSEKECTLLKKMKKQMDYFDISTFAKRKNEEAD